MSSQALRIFGSVFFVVALVGFATIFGNLGSPSLPLKPSHSSIIQNKSSGATIISNQVSSSKLLDFHFNGFQFPEPDSSSWIDAHILEGRDGQNQVNDSGSSLPDDFIFISGCNRPGYRC